MTTCWKGSLTGKFKILLNSPATRLSHIHTRHESIAKLVLFINAQKRVYLANELPQTQLHYAS